jgi:hypothetical protein
VLQAQIYALEAEALSRQPVAVELRQLAQERQFFFAKIAGKIFPLPFFFAWIMWDPTRTPLLLILGCILGIVCACFGRFILRREGAALESLLTIRSERIAVTGCRTRQWKHRTRFRNYHLIYALLVLLWLTFAVYARTVSAVLIATIIGFAVYAEVFLPLGVLNSVPRPQLQKPRWIFGCWALSHHVFCNWIIYGASLSALHWSLAQTFSANVIILILCAIPATVLGYHYSIRGVLSLLKWIIAGPVRIVVFRRYSTEAAVVHRSTVMPVVGAYGYLVAFEDTTLHDFKKAGPFWESQDLLAGFHYHMLGGTEDWLSRIRVELDCADFVIFDWHSEPTANMTLEFEAARELLPEDRLIWIISSERVGDVVAWLSDHRQSRPKVVAVTDSRAKLRTDLRRVMGSASQATRWQTVVGMGDRATLPATAAGAHE